MHKIICLFFKALSKIIIKSSLFVIKNYGNTDLIKTGTIDRAGNKTELNFQ